MFFTRIFPCNWSQHTKLPCTSIMPLGVKEKRTRLAQKTLLCRNLPCYGNPQLDGEKPIAREINYKALWKSIP